MSRTHASTTCRGRILIPFGVGARGGRVLGHRLGQFQVVLISEGHSHPLQISWYVCVQRSSALRAPLRTGSAPFVQLLRHHLRGGKLPARKRPLQDETGFSNGHRCLRENRSSYRDIPLLTNLSQTIAAFLNSLRRFPRSCAAELKVVCICLFGCVEDLVALPVSCDPWQPGMQARHPHVPANRASMNLSRKPDPRNWIRLDRGLRTWSPTPCP